VSGPAYSTVLVGTDGSESSFRAVDRAAAVARDAGASLLLACAFRPMTERELRDAADRAKTVGAKNIDTLAVEGDPVDALVDLVSKRKVDLLVVGNRGLNSLAGRLLGSVPANISHRAACDVLIVHTTGRVPKK
jgi:nucleotide-binding universal stress UspA family protein